ncbi:MAG: FAD-binding oxidoreductase [Caldilineales bacterium]|nr:FAD-binding oxidoreductase [Caldilineales bacterium]MCW5859782.1 FAD-binding oxidoreductase [Caldilineales bacterium]
MAASQSMSYDAIVVGAGYIGCSVAYHLAAAGLRTTLVDRGGVGAGASRANYGNIQIQDAELDHSLPLLQAGRAAWDQVEAELGDVGRRPLGGLLLIENEAQWQIMAGRLPRLHAAGIAAELVPAAHLPEIEALLDPTTVLGGCYHPHEGQIDPFRLLQAFVRGGRRRGMALHLGLDVTDIIERDGRVQGVRTGQGELSAGAVVLCTGAWTPALGEGLGRCWPAAHVHGQALVTEAAPGLRLHNHIASAAFFEQAHEGGEADEAVLAIAQTAHGHFLLGEAARVTADLGKGATEGGQRAIARLVGRHFPALRGLRVLRGWAAPVAFTHDGLPLFGPVPGIEGLILATAFKSTVIVTPLAGRIVTQWVLHGRSDLDLAAFSPDRDDQGATHLAGASHLHLQP